MKHVDFSSLIGETLTKIVGSEGDGEILFVSEKGSTFKLYHSQDCCESVTVDSITGDLFDLLGSPILMAEESTSSENPSDVKMDYQDSFTWTFYKLATIKGYVDIRWYGESNGYYSENVDFVVF